MCIIENFSFPTTPCRHRNLQIDWLPILNIILNQISKLVKFSDWVKLIQRFPEELKWGIFKKCDHSFWGKFLKIWMVRNSHCWEKAWFSGSSTNALSVSFFSFFSTATSSINFKVCGLSTSVPYQSSALTAIAYFEIFRIESFVCSALQSVLKSLKLKIIPIIEAKRNEAKKLKHA